MSYDYHGAWDNVTGINAPLYGRDLSEEEDDDGRWKNVVSYNDDKIGLSLSICALEYFNTLLVIQRLSSEET
jgi:GH18 family chitinase